MLLARPCTCLPPPAWASNSPGTAGRGGQEPCPSATGLGDPLAWAEELSSAILTTPPARGGDAVSRGDGGTCLGLQALGTPHCSQCCCWGWAPATTALQAVPTGSAAPGPCPCPPPIPSAARRTITSLAPASSVRPARDVRNEPSSTGPAWPPSHPAGGAGTAPHAWPPVPRHPPPSPAIASISAQHAALPGWRVPGVVGRRGWDGGWRGERATASLPPPPPPSPRHPGLAPPCWGGHAVTRGDVASFALLFPPWELSAELGLISSAPSDPRSLSLCLAPPPSPMGACRALCRGGVTWGGGGLGCWSQVTQVPQARGAPPRA